MLNMEMACTILEPLFYSAGYLTLTYPTIEPQNRLIKGAPQSNLPHNLPQSNIPHNLWAIGVAQGQVRVLQVTGKSRSQMDALLKNSAMNAKIHKLKQQSNPKNCCSFI